MLLYPKFRELLSNPFHNIENIDNCEIANNADNTNTGTMLTISM